MMSNQSSLATTSFPIQAGITERLTQSFAPTHLQVINESHLHNVPANSESHFKVIVVSERFESAKTPVQRHRMVHAALAEYLDSSNNAETSKSTIHALSIVAKTPSQWEANSTVPLTPNCRGGDGSLPPKQQ